jgi:hypothetical protein
VCVWLALGEHWCDAFVQSVWLPYYTTVDPGILATTKNGSISTSPFYNQDDGYLTFCDNYMVNNMSLAHGFCLHVVLIVFVGVVIVVILIVDGNLDR